MAQFMTNIPRRKIYETMLEFEDAMLEMNILLYNQENFDKFKEKFNSEAIIKLKDSFIEIKALIIMFLENKKFANSDEFQNELNFLSKDKEINNKIKNNVNVIEKLKKSIFEVDKILFNLKKVENFEKTKKIFLILDEFNSQIPKFLEKRRDEMINSNKNK